MQAHLSKSSPLSKYDRIRIVGQGLAGSLLAIHLKEQNIPFIVQDIDTPGCATAVAPGIVNPLAGRHFRPPEYIDELLEQLSCSMKLVEKTLGVDVWNPCPILRMFSEPAQHDRFMSSIEGKGSAAFVDDEFGENTFSYLNDVYGSFLTKRGGWANLPFLMEITRSWLRQEGLLVEKEWIPPESAPTKAEDNELVVFCEGWRTINNPYWSFIPHNPAKGEMILVRFEEPIPRDRIYNQSCWAQPVRDDLWRVGATYSWDAFDSKASLEGATSLQDSLHLLTPIPFHVEDQMAGVRPIVEDYRPVVGQHPEIPHWYILNALGSKGVLQAPTAVRDLIDHLLEGSRIPGNWCVDRFEK
jgi:glycine oxidase